MTEIRDIIKEHGLTLKSIGIRMSQLYPDATCLKNRQILSRTINGHRILKDEEEEMLMGTFKSLGLTTKNFITVQNAIDQLPRTLRDKKYQEIERATAYIYMIL